MLIPKFGEGFNPLFLGASVKIKTFCRSPLGVPGKRNKYLRSVTTNPKMESCFSIKTAKMLLMI